MDVSRELKLLKASPRERKGLLKQPPSRPTHKQIEALRHIRDSGGTAPAATVHYRTGLVMTARRWVRLIDAGDDLVFAITDGGRDVLQRLGKD